MNYSILRVVYINKYNIYHTKILKFSVLNLCFTLIIPLAMKFHCAVIGLAVFVCLVVVVSSQPACICFETLADDLKSPTVLHEPNDGTGRLLIATLEGVIYVYYKDGSKENKPFLNITQKVVAGNERGLVGLVTHPNFKDNRRFYIYYTTPSNGKALFRLSQFMVESDSPNEADPDSEVVMIERLKATNIHHAGQVKMLLIIKVKM